MLKLQLFNGFILIIALLIIDCGIFSQGGMPPQPVFVDVEITISIHLTNGAEFDTTTFNLILLSFKESLIDTIFLEIDSIGNYSGIDHVIFQSNLDFHQEYKVAIDSIGIPVYDTTVALNKWENNLGILIEM